MDEQLVLQTVLNEKFNEYRGKNPRYSLRAYAQKLGISSGALSRILGGHRRVSKKMAQRLAARLCLKPEETAEFLNLFPDKTSYGKAEQLKRSEQKIRRLKSDEFSLLSRGIHFAILSLLETSGGDGTVEWMAMRLNSGRPVVRDALERLRRMNLVRLRKGKWEWTGIYCSTTDEIDSSSVRQSHFESLEQAKETLETTPLELRDFTSLTFALDRDQLIIYKRLIRQFRKKILELTKESVHKDAVYKLALQFFPLTKENHEK